MCVLLFSRVFYDIVESGLSSSNFGHVRVYSRRNSFRGLVSRFPVFFGLVAGTTFFLVSSLCIAALLLPMVCLAAPPEPGKNSPVHSDFSPKRESKSPGPPKPRSRVRYEDEKKPRRQRQYTAGGVGSGRSRSSKSSRRSLVGFPWISVDFTRLMSASVQQRRCSADWGTRRLWKRVALEEEFMETRFGGRMRRLSVTCTPVVIHKYFLCLLTHTCGCIFKSSPALVISDHHLPPGDTALVNLRVRGVFFICGPWHLWWCFPANLFLEPMSSFDVQSLFGVNGKVVLVTGGSRGIGKMVRLRSVFIYSSAGCHACITGRIHVTDENAFNLKDCHWVREERRQGTEVLYLNINS